MWGQDYGVPLDKAHVGETHSFFINQDINPVAIVMCVYLLHLNLIYRPQWVIHVGGKTHRYARGNCLGVHINPIDAPAGSLHSRCACVPTIYYNIYHVLLYDEAIHQRIILVNVLPHFQPYWGNRCPGCIYFLSTGFVILLLGEWYQTVYVWNVFRPHTATCIGIGTQFTLV